jgi:hypothetical protein
LRPVAPDLMLPPEDHEQTPADTPLAREVRAALVGPLHSLRVLLFQEMATQLASFEGRVCESLVEAVTRSHVQRRNEERLDRLEEHCFKTEPAPPPDAE